MATSHSCERTLIDELSATLEMHCLHWEMQAVHWGGFDLNLLVVFDAVMRERSITRAAATLGLSQPATSHALTRLRHRMKDDLFIRTPSGMVPTPRAEKMAGPVRQALAEIGQALEPDAFVPAQAERRFAVAVDNAAAILLAPALAAAVAAEAPNVRLELRPSGTLPLATLLDRGELDLLCGGPLPPQETLRTETLFSDELVLVLRRGHPASKGELSAARIASLAFLDITSSGDDLSFLDDWLAENKHQRRVVCRAPYLAAAGILANSDRVAVMRCPVAEVTAAKANLMLLRLPIPAPPARIMLTWPARLGAEPAHLWLRELVRVVAAGLPRSNSSGEFVSTPEACARQPK